MVAFAEYRRPQPERRSSSTSRSSSRTPSVALRRCIDSIDPLRLAEPMTSDSAPVPNPQDPPVQADTTTPHRPSIIETDLNIDTESDAQRPSGNPWEGFNTAIVAPQPVMDNHGRASSLGRRPRSSSRDTRRVSIQLSSQSTTPSARRGHVQRPCENRRPLLVCNAFGDREDILDEMYDYLRGLEGLDQCALMLFWTMVHLSPDGRKHAEQIYATATGGRGGNNPNAFVTSRIENARRELFPDGAVYANMQGRY